jgi:hypothetical protein
MTWLTPVLAAVAAAVAVPLLLLLYFLKLRRREVEVSTTLLWRKAIQDLQANAPFQRIRRNILLLLQLLVLGAVLAALGQPQIRGESEAGLRHIILIDRSASMQTRDEGGATPESRLEAARRQALRLVEGLREPTVLQKDRADQAMVISFDASARVVQNFTSDKGLLRAAIGSITPADTPTSIGLAIRLAKAQSPTRLHVDRDGTVRRVEGLTEGPPSVIHIFSDGRVPDAEEANPGPGERIVFSRVGRPETGNLAIVALRAERAFDEPSRLSIYVGMESTHAEERTADVELLLDGVVTMIRPVTMPGARAAEAGGRPPAAVGGVVFTLERETGALAQVRLRSGGGDLTDDPLEVDNRAWLVVPAARRLSVALVTHENLFLRTALEGMPLARLTVLTPEQFEAAAWRATDDHDVVILDGWVPAEDSSRAPVPGAFPPTGLPRGRFLVLGAIPGGKGGYQLVEGGATGAQALIDWRRDHPVLRGLPLDGVAIAQARGVMPAEGVGVLVLARADAGPAIVEVADERSRAIVTTFAPTDSNWPLNWSFVVFLAQAVRYLGDERAAAGSGPAPGEIQTGDIIRERVPSGVAEVEVVTPTGERRRMPVGSDGQVVLGPVEAVGPYRLSWSSGSGRSSRLVAANLLDSAESDVRASEELALATAAVGAATGQTKLERRLWPWLILAALGVIMLEWFVYNRKVHL